MGNDFALGLFLGVTFSGVLLISLLNTQETKWEQQAISRGYASYCPTDGEWAWKGECKE